MIPFVPILYLIAATAQPALPPAPTNHPARFTNCFVVVAHDAAGNQSPPSAELATNRPAPFILGWNPVAGAAGYTLLQGRFTGLETNAIDAGTNLQVWWPGAPKTNLVITITADPLILNNPVAPQMFFALCATTNLSVPFRPIGHIRIVLINY